MNYKWIYSEGPELESGMSSVVITEITSIEDLFLLELTSNHLIKRYERFDPEPKTYSDALFMSLKRIRPSHSDIDE